MLTIFIILLLLLLFYFILFLFITLHTAWQPPNKNIVTVIFKLFYKFSLSSRPQSSVFVPPVSVLTWVSVRAGGVGVQALSVEDDPGGCRCRVLWGSPAAAAVLAAWVERQGHLHTHLAEGRTHTAAQDHGRKMADVAFFFPNKWLVLLYFVITFFSRMLLSYKENIYTWIFNIYKWGKCCVPLLKQKNLKLYLLYLYICVNIFLFFTEFWVPSCAAAHKSSWRLLHSLALRPHYAANDEFTVGSQPRKNVILYIVIAGRVQAVVSSQSTCDVGTGEETLRLFGSAVRGSDAEWRRRPRHQCCARGASWEICSQTACSGVVFIICFCHLYFERHRV